MPLINSARPPDVMLTRYGSLILSCEHASNRVPARYAALFDSRAAQRALSSHRGWDIGAATIARELSRTLHCPLFVGRATRLLVDLNRTRRHPKLLSEFSRSLSPDARERLLRELYFPYVQKVHDAVSELQAQAGKVVHLSVHSFTPELDGQVRNADLGLLYDPARRGERALSLMLRDALKRIAPTERVRRNYPYRGAADGMVTSLRSRFSPSQYVGIELEVNQGRLGAGGARLRKLLVRAVAEVLAPSEASPSLGPSRPR